MDIYLIEGFCERWLDKANLYQADRIDDLFDKFFTLFVVYNRLYSASAELHRATLDIKTARMLRGDRREATEAMHQIFRKMSICDALRNEPALAAACIELSDSLVSNRFFLHTIPGTKEPDLAKDKMHAARLRNCSLLTVLECLYQIRCNIFHGEKELAPQQAEILVPAITLLEAVVSMSRKALHYLVESHRI